VYRLPAPIFICINGIFIVSSIEWMSAKAATRQQQYDAKCQLYKSMETAELNEMRCDETALRHLQTTFAPYTRSLVIIGWGFEDGICVGIETRRSSGWLCDGFASKSESTTMWVYSDYWWWFNWAERTKVSEKWSFVEEKKEKNAIFSPFSHPNPIRHHRLVVKINTETRGRCQERRVKQLQTLYQIRKRSGKEVTINQRFGERE
jgi:hypothetical protein